MSHRANPLSAQRSMRALNGNRELKKRIIQPILRESTFGVPTLINQQQKEQTIKPQVATTIKPQTNSNVIDITEKHEIETIVVTGSLVNFAKSSGQNTTSKQQTSSIDDIDDDMFGDAGDDDDEIQDDLFDPFATNNNNKTKNNAVSLYDDEESSDDGEGNSDDDNYDDDDEEALLAAELNKIKTEKTKEEQYQIKQEEHFQQRVNDTGGDIEQFHGYDPLLFSNPLLANKMVQLIESNKQILTSMNATAGIKQENLGDLGAGLKRKKKWTEDSTFTNTALVLGDETSDGYKKQRLNNDTLNNDTHQDFLKRYFK